MAQAAVEGISWSQEARRGELREVSLDADRGGARVKDAAGGPLAAALIDAAAQTHAPALAAVGWEESDRRREPLAEYEAHVTPATCRV